MIVISGLGQCSALGLGLDGLRQAWLDGAQPKVSVEVVETASGPRDVSVYRVPPVILPPKLVPEAVERRMSRFARMAFATMNEALADAGSPAPADRSALVVGSAYGCLDVAMNYQNRIFQYEHAGASPTLFASSIHNSLASQLTLAFGIRGPNSTVATMEQTPVSSFRLAYDWIQKDLADRVVVLLGDELTAYHLYALSQTEQRLPAGEGMTAFVLDRESLAAKRYARLEAPQMVCESPPAGKVFSAGTHASLYGDMAIGTAFETLLAALHVEREGEIYSCVQDTPGLAQQSLTLTPYRNP